MISVLLSSSSSSQYTTFLMLMNNPSQESKEMRARWAGIDESIGTKMCWKLVDDNSGEIVCRSAIRSAIELGAANFQIDHMELLPNPIDGNDGLIDNFISLANFKTPLSHTTLPDPVGSIPASTKSQVWQETVRGVENHEDTQQQHFHSS